MPSFQAPARWITVCSLLQILIPARSAVAQPIIPGRRVILVHGINDSARAMSTLQRRLESRGYQAFALSLKPNNASVTFDVMARQLDAFVSANIPAGEKFDLVAFSMGGLVSRFYVQNMEGYRHVRRFVTISTPNHGTIWAWLSGRPGVKQMRPDSDMLRQLNSDVGTLASLGYTSIYTPFDLSIVPASSSRMAVAHNVVIICPLHPLMVILPGPIHAVERALE
jgi:triacylglycerol lipase